MINSITVVKTITIIITITVVNACAGIVITIVVVLAVLLLAVLQSLRRSTDLLAAAAEEEDEEVLVVRPFVPQQEPEEEFLEGEHSGLYLQMEDLFGLEKRSFEPALESVEEEPEEEEAAHMWGEAPWKPSDPYRIREWIKRKVRPFRLMDQPMETVEEAGESEIVEAEAIVEASDATVDDPMEIDDPMDVPVDMDAPMDMDIDAVFRATRPLQAKRIRITAGSTWKKAVKFQPTLDAHSEEDELVLATRPLQAPRIRIVAGSTWKKGAKFQATLEVHSEEDELVLATRPAKVPRWGSPPGSTWKKAVKFQPTMDVHLEEDEQILVEETVEEDDASMFPLDDDDDDIVHDDVDIVQPRPPLRRSLRIANMAKRAPLQAPIVPIVRRPTRRCRQCAVKPKGFYKV